MFIHLINPPNPKKKTSHNPNTITQQQKGKIFHLLVTFDVLVDAANEQTGSHVANRA